MLFKKGCHKLIKNRAQFKIFTFTCSSKSCKFRARTKIGGLVTPRIITLVQEKSLQQGPGAHQENHWILGQYYDVMNCRITATFYAFAASKIGFSSLG